MAGEAHAASSVQGSVSDSDRWRSSRRSAVPGERDAEISLDRLNLRAENITNSTELAPTLMAKLSADARLLSSGTFQLQAQGYPLAKVPTFNADLSSSDIDLSVLREIIQKAVDIDVRDGIAGLYVEAAAADGYISGYAKPVFDHLELEPPVHSGFFAHLKAWAAKAVTWLVTNKRKDRIATRLDFEGAVDDPDLDITDAVLRFIRNAFSTAERASLWSTASGSCARRKRPTRSSSATRASRAGASRLSLRWPRRRSADGAGMVRRGWPPRFLTIRPFPWPLF